MILDRELIEKLLLSKRIIDETGGCWLWIGPRHNLGYGNLYIDSVALQVHRLSAYLYLDYDFNSKLQVNHKYFCRNKHCFNPEHIYIGTHQDNMNDEKLARVYCRSGKHILSDSSAIKRRVNGKWQRQCRLCQMEARARRYNQTGK